MTRCGLLYLLLGSLSWGQLAREASTPSTQPTAGSAPANVETTSRDRSLAQRTNAGPDKPLITIAGLCDKHPNGNVKAANCETVITRAQFEKIIAAVQPNMPARARREFALHYADALVMTRKAEQMGLDKGETYEEQIRIARIEVLSNDFKKVMQAKTSQISDQDLQDYYQKNLARFERAEVDRIYVPKAQQLPLAGEEKLTNADRQRLTQESERIMKTEADDLRARAAAGEDFVKLQADAYLAAGIKSAAPNTAMEIRRTSLPPSQVPVMNLKPGEVSAVLPDPNGYAIYRIKAKYAVSLEQARDEIKATLRSLRMQAEMQDIEDSVTPTLDASYFLR
jgi:hypothetical protein